MNEHTTENDRTVPDLMGHLIRAVDRARQDRLAGKSHPASPRCGDDCPTWLNSSGVCSCVTDPTQSAVRAEGGEE